MKRLAPVAAGVALIAGLGIAAVSSSFDASAQDSDKDSQVVKMRIPIAKPGTVEKKVQVAAAEQEVTKSDDKNSEAKSSDASSTDTSEKEEKPMSDDKTAERTPEEQDIFKQTMHEGDIALGVCGARVSALLWFYEASVAQGRDDLKPAVESLTESREAIKAEAERRAVEDKVDTSVRVMNSESEKIWNDLNEKAAGDPKDFQKAHDELYAGVQECLGLFFDTGEAKDAKPAKAKKAAAKKPAKKTKKAE